MTNLLLPIDEARKRQEKRQWKAIRSFCISLLTDAVATLLLVHFTDYFDRIPSLYVFPLLAAALCFYRTRMHLFFTPKERTGTVRHTEEYEVATRARKQMEPMRRVMGQEMCIVIDLDDGKSVVMRFPGGKAVEALRDGDRVALLRFLVWPVQPDA